MRGALACKRTHAHSTDLTEFSCSPEYRTQTQSSGHVANGRQGPSFTPTQNSLQSQFQITSQHPKQGSSRSYPSRPLERARTVASLFYLWVSVSCWPCSRGSGVSSQGCMGRHVSCSDTQGKCKLSAPQFPSYAPTPTSTQDCPHSRAQRSGS